MDGPILEAEHLTKHFGRLKAVDKVGFSVKPGEIYSLIGPNGAGKTTLIKMLVGLLSPDSGKVMILGRDISTDPVAAKKLFGYLPDDPLVYDFLTGNEFLSLTGALNGLSAEKTRSRIEELSGIFPIRQILGERMGNYSRGNRQKTAFLASLIAEHRLLVIDEPVAGLDPASITVFGNYLSRFADRGGAVFLATHTLSFASRYASRVGVMNQGRLVGEEKISGSDLDSLYTRLTGEK